MGEDSNATKTVLILCFSLLGLVVLLIIFYKKLNKEADGKYTVRNIVYRKGGIRDRVRGAALAVGTCLGVRLWPSSETEEDGEEMQEIQDEEGQVEEGDEQGSDSEGDDEEEQSGERKGKEGDSSDDDSSSQGSNQEEQAKLKDQQEGETEEKREKKEETVEEEGAKGEASGGPGLLIDLKQFSGSAIWSEEGRCEVKDGDVTAL
ncbi:uncharacterized protein si:ch211-119e14.1 [Anabas testudineus]|uniref:uncharacterized protein si:ch211-119e14.1 n=1 Tax=Anabas testudineus TaxID=64144 RepID=UPI00143D9DBA|nr:uncharacterized protein si:ch211-119e14.1 [Anabas testudineus]